LNIRRLHDSGRCGPGDVLRAFRQQGRSFVSRFENLRALAKERQALSHGTSVEEQIFRFSHEMLTQVNEHRHLFQATVGKSSGAMIQSVIHKLLLDLLRDDVKAMSTRKGDRTSIKHSEIFPAIGEVLRRF
jgi:hypothetical protein